MLPANYVAPFSYRVWHKSTLPFSVAGRDRWPCRIRFRLFPRASALGKRCTVVDTVSKQYRTPPRSPIRARGQKCMLSDDAREKSVSGACVPTAGMKAHGRANRLIDLVLSSTIDHTQRVFTKRASWQGRFFLQDPLPLTTH